MCCSGLLFSFFCSPCGTVYNVWCLWSHMHIQLYRCCCCCWCCIHMQIHRRKSVEIQRKSCVSERQYDNDWADGFKSRIKYTLVRAYKRVCMRVYVYHKRWKKKMLSFFVAHAVVIAPMKQKRRRRENDERKNEFRYTHSQAQPAAWRMDANSKANETTNDWYMCIFRYSLSL